MEGNKGKGLFLRTQAIAELKTAVVRHREK